MRRRQKINGDHSRKQRLMKTQTKSNWRLGIASSLELQRGSREKTLGAKVVGAGCAAGLAFLDPGAAAAGLEGR